MFLIKPVNGKRVLDPATGKVVSADGVKVETISTYWFRRIQDGDVASQPVVAPVDVQGKAKKSSKDEKEL